MKTVVQLFTLLFIAFFSTSAFSDYKGLQITSPTASTIQMKWQEITVQDSALNIKRFGPAYVTLDFPCPTGANCVDVGMLAANSWYSLWVIYNPTTGTLAGLASLSATRAGLALPSGYTYAVRYGWFKTSPSSPSINNFTQVGNEVFYPQSGATALDTGVKGNISNTYVPLYVLNNIPSTALTIKVVVGSAGIAIVSADNATGFTGTAGHIPLGAFTNGAFNTTSVIELALESYDIWWASNSASSWVAVLGYRDNI